MNRNAIILTPTRALVDWVNSLDPEFKLDFASMQDHDSSDVFLVDEFETVEETETWMKENYLTLLEEMLIGWVENKELWPELSWDLFLKFIHYSIQTVVYDLGTEPLDHDDVFTFSES